MSNLQVIPFAPHSTNLRVIESPIGKVIPIVDIVKTIDHPHNKIIELINRNSELFEGALYTVTVHNAFEQTTEKGKTYARKRNFQVKALNSHGIVGLLMKLDYNRIQSEEKKQSIITFQKWAIKTLTKAIKVKNFQPKVILKKSIQEVAEIPPNTKFVHIPQVAYYFKVNKQVIRKCILANTLEGYKYRWEYVIKQSTFDQLIALKTPYFTIRQPVLNKKEQLNELKIKTEELKTSQGLPKTE